MTCMNTMILDFLFRICLAIGVSAVALVFGLLTYSLIYLAVMLYTIAVGALM